MANVTLAEFWDVLTLSNSINLVGVAVVQPRITPLTGQEDNVFLDTQWTDGNNGTQEAKFQEGINNPIFLPADGVYSLTDTNGEVYSVILNLPPKDE